MAKNNKGTEPARSRPGSSYPGGKHLRKASARLAARRQGCEEIREQLRKRAKSVPESAFTMPGSMK